ncbi:MAG: hypothetical protein LUP99_02735 [Methanomicrobiales archaeon]|nr:hypothetical protein [Methanomicrobiales archaeon]
MASRGILVSRQVYSKNSPVHLPPSTDYFEVVNRSEALKEIDDRVTRAMLWWDPYSNNHEIDLFA